MPYAPSPFATLKNPDGSPYEIGYVDPRQAAPRRRYAAPPLQPVRTADQAAGRNQGSYAPPAPAPARSAYAPGTPQSDISAYRQQEEQRQALRQQNAQQTQAADVRQRAQAEINRQAQELARGGMSEWAFKHYQTWQQSNPGSQDMNAFNAYLTSQHAAERQKLLGDAQVNVQDLQRRAGQQAPPLAPPAPPVAPYSMQDATAAGIARTAAENPYQYATNQDPSGLTSVVNNYRYGDPAGDRGATQGTVDLYARNAMGDQIAGGATIDGWSMTPEQRRQAEAGGAKLWYGAPPVAQTPAYTPQEAQAVADNLKTVQPGGDRFNVAPPLPPSAADVQGLNQARADLSAARLAATTPAAIANQRASAAASDEQFQRALLLTQAANPPKPTPAPDAPADRSHYIYATGMAHYNNQMRGLTSQLSAIDKQITDLSAYDSTKATQAAPRIAELKAQRNEMMNQLSELQKESSAFQAKFQNIMPGGIPAPTSLMPPPTMSFNPTGFNDTMLTGVPPINLAAPPTAPTAQAPSTAAQAPARPRTPQEAAALPPGTLYITPDGRTMKR